MVEIRLAAAVDAQALLEMGRAMHAESPRYAGMPFDDQRVRAQIAAFTNCEVGVPALLLVAVQDGRHVGMAAVLLAERWFGPERYVTDRVVYVTPEARGGRAFPKLVRAIEAWAVGVGAAEIDIGVSTGVHVEETVHAYQRLGYTLDSTRVVTKNLSDVHRT